MATLRISQLNRLDIKAKRHSFLPERIETFTVDLCVKLHKFTLNRSNGDAGLIFYKILLICEEGTSRRDQIS